MAKSLKQASRSEIETELARRDAEEQKEQEEQARLVSERIRAGGRAAVDAFCPDHGRTSCNDENRANGFSSARNGRTAPRCNRCALLEILDGRNMEADVRIELSITHEARQ